MERLNGEMKAAIGGDDFDRYYEKNLAFHDVFLRHSGNDYLKRTVAFLKKRLYDFPRLEGFVKEWELASIGEHAELVALLAQEAPDRGRRPYPGRPLVLRSAGQVHRPLLRQGQRSVAPAGERP